MDVVGLIGAGAGRVPGFTGGALRGGFCSDGFRDGPFGLAGLLLLLDWGGIDTAGDGGTFSLGGFTGAFAGLSLVVSAFGLVELSSVREGAAPLPLATLPAPRPPRPPPRPGRPLPNPRNAEPGSPPLPQPERLGPDWLAHIEEFVPAEEGGGTVEEDIICLEQDMGGWDVDLKLC